MNIQEHNCARYTLYKYCHISPIKKQCNVFIFLIIFFRTDGIKARLMDGNSPADGRVEIFKNGGWGSVCAPGFDMEEAHVICSMAGFK